MTLRAGKCLALTLSDFIGYPWVDVHTGFRR